MRRARATLAGRIARTMLDHWESGEDFLPKADRHDSFVEYQGALLDEFRNLALQYDLETIYARQSVGNVFDLTAQ